MLGRRQALNGLLLLLLGAAVLLGDPSLSRLSVRGDSLEAAQAPIRAAMTVLVPWHYYDKSGKETGFDAELVREVGRRLNRQIQIVTVQWEGIFVGLQSKKYDMIPTITVTCERQKTIDYSVPYADTGLSVTVRKNDRSIQRVEDLKGKIVGVQGAGSGAHIWVTKNAGKYGIKQIKTYEDMASLMLDLQVGRIDAAVENYFTAAFYVKDKPVEVRVTGLTAVIVATGFRKGDPLRDAFDKALNAMKKDGTMVRIWREQLGIVSPKVMLEIVPHFDACK
jgi:polar amino acid transport system substrate-binding protein